MRPTGGWYATDAAVDAGMRAERERPDYAFCQACASDSVEAYPRAVECPHTNWLYSDGRPLRPLRVQPQPTRRREAVPNINDAFPSKYIRASDLRGAQPVVVIDHVSTEEVGKDREEKLVVYFRGKEKGFVLNKTNATKIAALTGSEDTDEWSGRSIRLYAAEVQFGSDIVEAIRVKPAGTNGKPVTTKPQAAPPPPPPPQEYHDGEPTDDEIPF